MRSRSWPRKEVYVETRQDGKMKERNRREKKRKGEI
jgi:hypothetical protein